jgi:predicted phosphodiesterase
MTELEEKIFELYKQGISLDKIQKQLSVPGPMFLNALKNIRYLFDMPSNYYSDGRIIYNPSKDRKEDQRIIQKGDSLHVLLYSDLHAGNKKDNLQLLDLIYDHATKENIHILLNLGDVIENTYSLPERCLRRTTVEGQIEYLLRHFPYDSSITNFILYGNHDHHALTDQGIDVAKIIEEERPDLVSLGYGKANINVRNSFITLQHNLNNRKIPIPEDAYIVFRGHSHKMKIDMRKDPPVILVPSLSDAIPENYSHTPIPGFLDATFTFDKEGEFDKLFLTAFDTDVKKRQTAECVLTLKKTIDKKN